MNPNEVEELNRLTQERLREFLESLSARGGEVASADTFSWALKLSKRQLRALAERSSGMIVSNDEGYALTTQNVRIARECMNRLRNQGRKMIQRADDIEAVLKAYTEVNPTTGEQPPKAVAPLHQASLV